MAEHEVGLFPHMTREEYDAVDALNASTLEKIQISPAHYQYLKAHPKPPTDPMRFGILVHLAVFEPHRLKDAVVFCDARGNSNEGKAAAAQAEREKKTVVSSDEWDLLHKVSAAIRHKSVAKELLDSRGFSECAIIWRDPPTGLLCKGRLDRFVQWHQWSVVVDLKTTKNAHYSEFKWDAKNFDYHVKAAWYLDALAALSPAERRFVWLAAEKEPPFECALYEPDDADLERGRQVYRGWINKYVECSTKNEWPGYPDGIEPMKLPFRESE